MFGDSPFGGALYLKLMRYVQAKVSTLEATTVRPEIKTGRSPAKNSDAPMIKATPSALLVLCTILPVIGSS